LTVKELPPELVIVNGPEPPMACEKVTLEPATPRLSTVVVPAKVTGKLKLETKTLFDWFTSMSPPDAKVRAVLLVDLKV
jgi:hypothetical protein